MGKGRGRATIELVFSAFDGALRPLPRSGGGCRCSVPDYSLVSLWDGGWGVEPGSVTLVGGWRCSRVSDPGGRVAGVAGFPNSVSPATTEVARDN